MLQKTLVNIPPNAIRKEKYVISFRTNVISTQISQICSGLHQLQNSNTEKCTEAEIKPVKQTKQDPPL